MTEFEKGHIPTVEMHDVKGYHLVCECGFKGRWVPHGPDADLLSATLNRRYWMHLMKALPVKYGIDF